MRKAPALLLVAGLSACAIQTAPQTCTEFRTAIQNGAMMTRHETREVHREFAKVVADLQRRSQECLALSVTRRAQQGLNVSQGTTTYVPRVTTVAPDKAELTIQQIHQPKPLGEEPEGGYTA